MLEKPDKQYLSVRQVQKITGLSAAEVARRISHGIYATVPDGKRIKVVRASVDQAIQLEVSRAALKGGALTNPLVSTHNEQH